MLRVPKSLHRIHITTPKLRLKSDSKEPQWISRFSRRSVKAHPTSSVGSVAPVPVVLTQNETTDISHVIYYIPLWPKPRILVDDKLLSKLKPNSLDDEFMAKQRADLFADLQKKHSKEIYQYSPHLWPGQSVRTLIYFSIVWCKYPILLLCLLTPLVPFVIVPLIGYWLYWDHLKTESSLHRRYMSFTGSNAKN